MCSVARFGLLRTLPHNESIELGRLGIPPPGRWQLSSDAPPEPRACLWEGAPRWAGTPPLGVRRALGPSSIGWDPLRGSPTGWGPSPRSLASISLEGDGASLAWPWRSVSGTLLLHTAHLSLPEHAFHVSVSVGDEVYILVQQGACVSVAPELLFACTHLRLSMWTCTCAQARTEQASWHTSAPTCPAVANDSRHTAV